MEFHIKNIEFYQYLPINSVIQSIILQNLFLKTEPNTVNKEWPNKELDDSSMSPAATSILMLHEHSKNVHMMYS